MQFLLIVMAVLSSNLEPSKPNRPDDAKPNIVIIFADDLGIGDVNCMNPSSRIPTPHIDRVAAEGMRFSDAHSPAAVCTPSRYALLTGRYPWRSNLKKWVLGGSSPALLEPDRATMASLLADEGYRTACVGKWHLGLGHADPVDWDKPLRPGPLQAGFHEFYGIPASLDMPPYVFIEDDHLEAPLSRQMNKSSHRRQNGGGFWRAGKASTDFRFEEVLPRIATRSCDIISQHARSQQEQPLFLYVPLTAPHTPWVPTDEFTGRTLAGYYGDFVAQVDDTVGQVIKALEETGELDDTLLIVTSDNGCHWPESDIDKWGHDGNAGWRGQKADIWEGGHRIPLLIRWQGVIDPDSTCDTTICLTDLFATCVKAGGGQWGNDAGEDSADLTPLLKQEPWTDPREGIIHQSGDGMLAIRCGKWKLIEAEGSGGFTQPKRVRNSSSGQLYDLKADPEESVNLWLEHPEQVARLQSMLDRLRDADRSVPMQTSSLSESE